ncbi:carbohydrate ABC transporter permease [Mahella australiensis]|uniref:Carbohydrate ABC transporter membrane protein 2, CUT1 family n=1 Tax=Mahella australiensis (strain DSM 15567 / CIP 107919 / 50-1 BON) TaxID=697281 RepID=F3ZVX7_MAHA5|nr:carbohydrate ABC transporter permease [Mahella australiensis]AEE95351.1 carbohydrate ABC transporter membrane protein 2, CUT1 family [Mahella australiensis 50-1 BON]
MKKKTSLGSNVFDIFNYAFLAFCAIITILPFIYVIAASFATDVEIAARPFFLFPKKPTLETYRYIFASESIIHSLFVSIYVTVVGTLVNLFFTFTMAYPLSKSNIVGKNWIINGIIFCMLFSGGMIPTYIVIKSLHLLDTYWALWLPGAISPFNLFIVRNFFQQLPNELEEAAKIDGCSTIGIFLRIILPLSMPIIATFTLFYGVGHWNNFFGPLLYINDSNKWPLQVMLRNIVLLSSGIMSDLSQFDPNFVPPEESLKMGVIVVGTVPILLVYPFLQKYFVKGVLVGSLKG